VLAKYLPEASGDQPGRRVASGIERDAEFLDLQAGFLASLDGYIARLRQAMARDDHAEVMEQAHQLKGLGGSFGYPEITAHATRLEAAIKAGRYPEGKALGDSLCQLLEQCALAGPKAT